jgi:hypothetical protein
LPRDWNRFFSPADAGARRLVADLRLPCDRASIHLRTVARCDDACVPAHDPESRPGFGRDHAAKQVVRAKSIRPGGLSPWPPAIAFVTSGRFGYRNHGAETRFAAVERT